MISTQETGEARNLSLSEADSAAKEQPDEAQKERMSCQERRELFCAEQKAVTDGLGQVREALVEANSRMIALEKAVEEEYIKKAYKQIVELYELIADVRDSTAQQAEKLESKELENAAYNMEAFLDMLSEYLADYGIQTISTPAGEPFSGKYHEVKNTSSFDPASSIIEKSLRSGFAWGEQVLKKEKVILR